eukprot:jgi/Bigna1/78324/fgenesh1_pg.54_\
MTKDEMPLLGNPPLRKGFCSKEMQDMLNLVAFNEKNVEVLGSFQSRSQFHFSDIDLFESNVRMPINRTADGFKKKTKKMLNDDKHCIGDVKCGVAEHLRVTNDDTCIHNNEACDCNRKETLERLHRLRKHLPNHKKLKRLIIPGPDEEQINKMKQMFRFHVVRWTPRETLQGCETLMDDSKCKLVEGMKSPALFELDFCKHVNDNDFSEFSVICDSRNSKGQKLNNVPHDAKQTLLNDINKCATEGQHFEVLKRRFSLLRCEHVFEKKKSDESKLIVPSKMPNGNLGNSCQVKALMDNLLFSMENFDDLNKDGMNKSIDDITDESSFASLSKFVREEDDIMDDLKMMLKGESAGDMSGNLEDVHDAMGEIMSEESHEHIKMQIQPF